MGTRRRDRTILGIGAVELPDDLRATLVDDDPPEIDDDEEEASPYRRWVGRVVDGRYRLDTLIAEGGMGAVFMAHAVSGGPPVALKVMHPELEGNTSIVQRFAREVEIGRRLKHPYVVEALDTGTMEDGSAYLVLELVTGPALSIVMWEDEQLEWRRAARIAAQIAAALAAAWDEGIVHRDLKPDNVILEPDRQNGETVKLLDFGIAHDKSVTDERAKLTMVGEVIGTIGYMAPEQTLGQPVDGRCDLYALGVLLWEMLAGRALFDEDLSHPQFLSVQLKTPPPPIAELAPETPEPLAALVHRLLAYSKAERPEDAAGVRAELLALLGESVADEPPPPTATPEAEPAAPEPATPAPAEVAPPEPAARPTAPSAPSALPSRAERRARMAPAKKPPWLVLAAIASGVIALLLLALAAAVFVALR